MSFALSSSLYPDVLRSFASASLTSSYQVLGTTLNYPTKIIRLLNNGTTDVTVSWDGITDHDYLPAGSFLLLDVSTNKETSQVFTISKGTQFLVKGTAGTGNIYLSSYYGR